MSQPPKNPELPATNSRQVGGVHYKNVAIQHWDFVIANEIPYMEAQVIRYILRWRKKGGTEDLRKAIHFIEKMIEVEEAVEPQAHGYVDQDRI